jgi:endonuclease-3
LSSERLRQQRVVKLLEERYGKGEEASHRRGDPFRTLIGCVLSHRTREENARRAAEALFEDVETADDVLGLPLEVLKESIRCSGFYNQKARTIRAICCALNAEHGGAVPEDRAELLSLPGVGPKTADIVLSHAFDRPAVAVDVHVARVARRLGLVDDEADVDEIKETLERLVPPERFRFLDSALVRHGKEYCRSQNPRCGECFMSDLCEHPPHQGDK